MIAAGESGGILDTILQRLSEYIEKRVKLLSSVRKALIYPTAIIVIAIGEPAGVTRLTGAIALLPMTETCVASVCSTFRSVPATPSGQQPSALPRWARCACWRRLLSGPR